MASLATADARPGKAAAKNSDETYAVSSLDRAIDILEAFTQRRPELGLKEIAAATGLHKATAFRLLAALCRRGLVLKHAETGSYRLGFRVIGLAEIAKASGGLAAEALPVMRTLRDALEETIFLSVRAGDWRIDLEQVAGLQSLRRVLVMGEPKSLHAGAASKLLLADMSDAEIAGWLARADLARFTKTTLTSPAALKREIAAIRRQGFAEGWDERNSGGAGVAAPLFGPSGTLLGALSAAIPTSRYAPELKRRTQALVREAAATISRRLGAPPDARLGGAAA
jgi:DNA-binding IclR family transcriptional regulator